MQTPDLRVPHHRSKETAQHGAAKPKLLDQVRIALRSRHYSKRTEQTYVNWIKRYIFFHKRGGYMTSSLSKVLAPLFFVICFAVAKPQKAWLAEIRVGPKPERAI